MHAKQLFYLVIRQNQSLQKGSRRKEKDLVETFIYIDAMQLRRKWLITSQCNVVLEDSLEVMSIMTTHLADLLSNS
jgi:hypothetical protein